MHLVNHTRVRTLQICSDTHKCTKSFAGLTENNEEDTDCLDALGYHCYSCIHQQQWNELIIKFSHSSNCLLVTSK